MVWIFQGKKIRKNSTFLKLACEKRQGDQVNKKTENLKQQQVSICEMEMDAGKKVQTQHSLWYDVNYRLAFRLIKLLSLLSL